MRFHLPSVSSLAEFFGKSNTFCINNHKFDYFLIVKNLTYLHFVKFANVLTFILLTICVKNLSFRYKSSKAEKIEGGFSKSLRILRIIQIIHSDYLQLLIRKIRIIRRTIIKLWLQRETKNQVSFLGAGVRNHLSEDRNRERIGDLDILRRLQREVGDREP